MRRPFGAQFIPLVARLDILQIHADVAVVLRRRRVVDARPEGLASCAFLRNDLHACAYRIRFGRVQKIHVRPQLDAPFIVRVRQLMGRFVNGFRVDDRLAPHRLLLQRNRAVFIDDARRGVCVRRIHHIGYAGFRYSPQAVGTGHQTAWLFIGSIRKIRHCICPLLHVNGLFNEKNTQTVGLILDGDALIPCGGRQIYLHALPIGSHECKPRICIEFFTVDRHVVELRPGLQHTKVPP